jgi:DhnA family fructose-bisphosphate aldolase class Ia
MLRNLQQLFDHGRLAGTGYVSILPVDQGIEHTAGASFAPNPIYFDPEMIVELAIEGGCNAVASTLGVLGAVARKYAHKIPFILKFNHNELMTYPNKYDQIFFAQIEQAFDMGAVAVGRPSILVPLNPAARSLRSARPLKPRTRWAWRPFYGATRATTPSRRRRRITMSPPT